MTVSATTPNALRTGSEFQQEITQHDGVVAVCIAGRVEERDLSVADIGDKLADSVSLGFEFLPISQTKFVESRRLVIEPRSQFRRWRDVASPRVDVCVDLLHSTRP